MAISAELDIKGWTSSPYLGTDTSVVVPYIVYTDTRTQTEQDIMASGVLPARGMPYGPNAYLAASGCNLKREDANPLVWRATVTYKTDSIDQKEKDKQDYPNPCDRPAEIEWDAVSYTKIQPETVEAYTLPYTGETSTPAGAPILNSAGDIFDPPVEVTDYRWTATVTKFVAAVPTWILEMAGRVNAAPFVIDGLPVARMSARVVGIRIGKRMRDNGVNYREIKFTIEFREARESRYEDDKVPEPYILELQDEGYNFNTGGAGNQGRIRVPNYTAASVINTTEGVVSPTAVLLDGAGLPLEDPDFESVVFLPFCVYRTADFSLLPLT